MKKKYIAVCCLAFGLTACDTANALRNDVSVHRFNQKQTYLEDRITRLEDGIISVPGVDTASVVILGHAAIVSISLTDEIGESQLTAIREAVSQCVNQLDPTIRRVSVTFAPELIKRKQPSHGTSTEPADSANDQDQVTNFRPVI